MKVSQDITLRIEWDTTLYPRGWRQALATRYRMGWSAEPGPDVPDVMVKRVGAIYRRGRTSKRPVTAEELEREARS